MIRRSFFQLLAGFSIPGSRWHTLQAPEAAEIVPKLAPFTPAPSPVDPEWLHNWLRLPRLPVISARLSQIADQQERELAALILQRIRSGSPFDFHYYGGSDPGKSRQVFPVLLFTTIPDSMPPSAGVLNLLYLLSWCQIRNAPRTFRLDRIQVAIP